MPSARKPKNLIRRKLGARLRQGLITVCCYLLGKVFALPGVRGAKPQLAPLKNLVNPRVVIIKPCCLGDIVLSTATLAALHDALPHSHFTYVVSSWARPALVNNPRLDEILDTGFDGSHFNRQTYFDLVRKLRRGHYDIAVVLDRSPLLALLPWLAGIQIRAGLDSLGRGFALNYNAKVWPGQPLHEAEVYLAVIRKLGLEPLAPRLEFYPATSAETALVQKAVAWGLDLNLPVAVIHPGGGHNPDTKVMAKRWPAPNFGKISSHLLQNGWQVVIIGAETDREVVAEALENISFENGAKSGNLFDASQQLDIAQTGALLQHARLFVGNDTGLMHLATTTKAAVVAIFGPSSPAMYGPYSLKGRAVSPVAKDVRSGLPLAEYQALSVEEGGIERVSVNEVWEAIEAAMS